MWTEIYRTASEKLIAFLISFLMKLEKEYFENIVTFKEKENNSIWKNNCKLTLWDVLVEPDMSCNVQHLAISTFHILLKVDEVPSLHAGDRVKIYEHKVVKSQRRY